MSGATEWQPERLAAARRHDVIFYEEEDALVFALGDFVEEGLARGEPILVLATAEHRRGLLGELRRRGCAGDAAVASGELVFEDARTTLLAITTNGALDRALVRATIGSMLTRLARLARPGVRVRVFGELVDLLCQARDVDGAVALENMWNDLAREHAFSLFCAYAMDGVVRDSDARPYARICATHTHATTPSTPAVHARLLALAEAQEHATHVEAAATQKKDSAAFQLLVETVRDYAIFMLDPKGYVTTWNVGAERIKGYRADEIIGQHFSKFYGAAEVASGKCERELVEAEAEGRFEDEGWRFRKDGKRFWANVVITALRDHSGTLVGFAKVTRDLTERRAAEEERIALARSEEANRVKDEFLATVSHELRTPLNAILGWATMLDAQVAEPFARKGVSTILRNARAQARLIEDLLDVSRIVSGKLRIDVAPVALEPIVREAIEVVGPAAMARGVALRFEGPREPAIVMGDATRLQQVVWNLLSNAVKFTDRGGAIDVRLDCDPAWSSVSITDTGRGIDPAFLPHVFERFRQAETSPSRSTSGLGIGLALVRNLVELHGGEVSASSEGKGRGATFAFRLPTCAEPLADEARSPSDSEAAAIRLDGVRVLVVDDDADGCDLVAMMLEKRGAQVKTASSADNARATFVSFGPDMVVSDVGMPGEDGYDLAKSIRALPRGACVGIVALTAYASARERRRALDAGFDEHVPKPVSADLLAVAVRRLSASPR